MFFKKYVWLQLANNGHLKTQENMVLLTLSSDWSLMNM